MRQVPRTARGARTRCHTDNACMVEESRVEVQKFVADHLGIELHDLVLIANTDSSYTFRRKSNDSEHVAQVEMGPEGPIVHVTE